MRKLTLVRVAVLCVCCRHMLYADGLFGVKMRGIYGNVEYGYMQDTNKMVSTNIDQTSFLQKYTLGMNGSIYSPNLISYLLQGSYLIDDINTQTNDDTMKSSRKTSNYRANADIIRSTKYPFSIYTDKTSVPYSSVQGNVPYAYDESSSRYGITGTALFPYFDFRYTAETSDVQRNETFADETRKGSNYSFGISKNFSNLKLLATYMDRNQDYKRDDKNLTAIQDWSDHSRDARVSGVWTPDQTLQVSSNLGYMQSSYSELKNLTANVNANWNPNDRFRVGGDITANTMQAGGTTSDMIAVSGNSSYRFTPEITSTQAVSLYRMTGGWSDMTVAMGTLGGRYVKVLDNNLTVNAGVDVSLRTEQHNVSADANATLQDRGIYTYTLTAGASKRIEALRANASANVSYFGSVSTLQEKTDRISLNANFNSQIQDNLSFSTYGFYVTEENSNYTGSESGLDLRNMQQLSINSMLRYWKEIGYNGKLSLGAGVMYTMTEMDRYERVNRVMPTIDGSLSYRFFDALFMTSGVMASQDTVSDLTNYSGNVSFNYNLRKVMMSMGARYLRQNGGTMNMYDSTRNSLYFKISRPF